MQPVNLYSFRKKVSLYKKLFKRFLTKVERNPPRELDKLTERLNTEIWENIDCLTCANCCKTMTPTYTPKDIKRISAHLGMTPKQFKNKWLYFDKKDGDWMNVQRPCQFLDLKTNMCSIYPVRPADCAGFPHFTKKKMVDYMHVHKQNIEYCPATYKMVERMQQELSLRMNV
jgi:Fe-S-cluster containining protein